MAARLKVELLVCPEPGCHLIGKLPNQYTLRGYCTGSVEIGTSHRKRRMQPVTFRGEAPAVEKAGASS